MAEGLHLDAFGQSGAVLHFRRAGRELGEESVTSTIWYDPLRIDRGSQRPVPIMPLSRGAFGESRSGDQGPRHLGDLQAVDQLACPGRSAAGGRGRPPLSPRAAYALLGEAGAVTGRDAAQYVPQGQVEEITLKISAVDKQTTGYQLAVTLPDKATETSLKDFYGSVLNGGAVNDQKGFDFGNETDGWYYAGACWMYGMALAAGVPAPGRLSSHPYDAARRSANTWRISSAYWTTGADAISATTRRRNGSTTTCTRSSAPAPTCCTAATWPSCVRTCPPWNECRTISSSERNDRRSVQDGRAAATGTTTPFAPAASTATTTRFSTRRPATWRRWRPPPAAPAKGPASIGDWRTSIKTAFNEVLVEGELPRRAALPRLDRRQGEGGAYFCDLCQWPAVALGIASPEQARKLVATADARIAQLEKEYGYQGFAGLSALWPVPPNLTPVIGRRSDIYMNGGSLLAQTYWEIVARTRAGDAGARSAAEAFRPARRRNQLGRRQRGQHQGRDERVATASPIWPTWWWCLPR